jgi:Ni,Fe-hydrogenase III small subunit
MICAILPSFADVDPMVTGLKNYLIFLLLQSKTRVEDPGQQGDTVVRHSTAFAQVWKSLCGFETERERLIIREGVDQPVEVNQAIIPKNFSLLFGSSLKLRQVSAGGDNSCEWELNAANNVQFDLSRFGIEFVASPRHADGIVITGPITANMAEPLQICYDATPDPKMVVLCGSDAISGGIFEGSPALDRSFLENNRVDLYIAGNPAHPLTIINGLLALTGRE